MSKSTVACYVRVSTVDQEKGIRSQEKALSDYLAAHGLEAKFYRDRLSGATKNRPAFGKLERDIFQGKIKTVIVWKLDRLSRSLRDGVNILTDWLERGVRVVAVSQQLDFSGPTGQLVASVMFALAQMERENLRENTKRGLAAAKARGVKLGKAARIHARDIKPLLREGYSMSRCANELGVSRQAIYDCLKREGVKPEDCRRVKKITS